MNREDLEIDGPGGTPGPSKDGGDAPDAGAREQTSDPVPRADEILGPILSRGVRPVRPLPGPWLLASVVIALGLAGPILFLLVMGFRAPRSPVVLAAVVVEFLAGGAVVASAFFWSLPARAPSGFLTGAVLAALLTVAAIAFVLPHVVSGYLVAGTSVAKGLACVGWEFGAALPMVVIILWFLMQMPPFHVWLTGFLGGVGAGLVADAANHLHCPALDPGHTVTWHLGGVLLLGLVSALARGLVARRL